MRNAVIISRGASAKQTAVGLRADVIIQINHAACEQLTGRRPHYVVALDPGTVRNHQLCPIVATVAWSKLAQEGEEPLPYSSTLLDWENIRQAIGCPHHVSFSAEASVLLAHHLHCTVIDLIGADMGDGDGTDADGVVQYHPERWRDERERMRRIASWCAERGTTVRRIVPL
jgi:hypothetical protein